MTRLLLLIPTALLTGCLATGVPVASKFPQPTSPEMLEDCPELKLIKDNTEKLTDVMDVVADNYKEYHLCRSKTADWIKWYKKQKQNFDSIK